MGKNWLHGRNAILALVGPPNTGRTNTPYPLDFTRNRRALVTDEFGRTSLLTLLVRVEQTTRMLPAEDHDVVTAFSPHRADRPLLEAISPR
jgi:hypothetical protein